MFHLSVPGDGGPWDGDPLAGSWGAWHHRVGALHDVALVRHGEAEALQVACLVEGAQSGGQNHELDLEPGQQQLQQQQLAAPSAASPSSQRI